MVSRPLVLLGVLASAASSAHAAGDIGTQPFKLMVDVLCPAIDWGSDYQDSMGGNTQPGKGEFGWGKPGKVVDTSKLSSAATLSGRQFGLRAPTTEMTVYGKRDPTPAAGAGVMSALVNGSQSPSNVIAPQDFQSSGQLVTVQLPMGSNGVTFSPTGAQGVYTIYGVEITLDLTSNFSSIDAMPTSTEMFVVNGTLNPRFSFRNSSTGVSSGTWKVKSANRPESETSSTATAAAQPSGGAGGASSSSGAADYWVATVDDSIATVDIGIPDGTTFVLINGTVGANGGNVNAEWQPNPLNDDSFSFLTRVNSSWVTPTILHYRQLNPTVRYTVRLSGAMSSNVALHSITYFNGLDIPQTNDTDSGGSGGSSGPNIGAIVGGTVGGVVGGLALAGLALWLCLWRPRKKKQREEAEAAAYLDNTGYTPFVQQEVDGGAVDEGSLTVPPSYNPAWAGESAALQGGGAAASPSVSHPPAMSEKQRMAIATQGGSPTAPSPGAPSPGAGPMSPIVADLKRPTYASGAPRTAAIPEKGSAAGSSEKNAMSTQSSGSGYSNGMMRALNPDP